MNLLISLLAAVNIVLPHSYFDLISTVSFTNNPPAVTGHEKGSYDVNTHEIKLYNTATIHHILHEIGHPVCLDHSTPEIFGKGEFLTKYADTSKEEDCAETFAGFYEGKCEIAFFQKFHPDLFKKCIMIKKWDLLESRKK